MVKGKLKILVADEIAVNRNLLFEILTDEYEILQAKDGLQIISMLEEYRNNLALILMNYTMPKFNGDEVLQEIQKMNLINVVPVIVVTELSNILGGTRALEFGAADVLHKPIEPNLLRKRIQNVLSAHEYNCLSPELKRKYHNGTDDVIQKLLDLTHKLEHYKTENELLKRLGKLDLLTQVYNGDTIYELVSNCLQKGEEVSGYMLVEFTNLEKIVEKYGIEKGKQILKLFGEILKAHFDNETIIGRIENACFLVFIKNFKDANYLKKRAQSIISNIKNAESELDGSDRIIVSIGVSKSPDNGRKYEELFFSAQRMLDSGKNNCDSVLKRDSFYMIEDDIIQEMARGNAFFNDVQNFIKSNPDRNYLFIRFDISEFKKYSEWNGYLEGEKLLNLLSEEFNQFVGDIGVAGQIYTDTFAVCAELEEDNIRQFLKQLEIKLFRKDTDIDLTPYCGTYRRVDPNVSILEMCNYAGLACQKAKQSKKKQIVVYHS